MFTPRTHLEDDLVNLIYTAMRGEPVSDATRREKLSQAAHAVFRTIKWEHGADYRARRGEQREIYDRLLDQADAAGVAVAGTWDGHDHDAGALRASVDGLLTLLRDLFPTATI